MSIYAHMFHAMHVMFTLMEFSSQRFLNESVCAELVKQDRPTAESDTPFSPLSQTGHFGHYGHFTVILDFLEKSLKNLKNLKHL